MVALPGEVVAGSNTTVGFSWSGLAQNSRYLAGVLFLDDTGVLQANSLLRVETGTAGIPRAEGDRGAAPPKD